MGSKERVRGGDENAGGTNHHHLKHPLTRHWLLVTLTSYYYVDASAIRRRSPMGG